MVEGGLCELAPWNMQAVLRSHATLAGILAGVSITAMVLVVAPTGGSTEGREEPVQRAAALCLLTAGLAGLVASYAFSAGSGDRCLVAYASISFPSVLLAGTGILLFGGLALFVMARMGDQWLSRAAWLIIAVASILIVTRLTTDLIYWSRMGRVIESFDVDGYLDVEEDLVATARRLAPDDDRDPVPILLERLWVDTEGSPWPDHSWLRQALLILLAGVGIRIASLGWDRKTSRWYATVWSLTLTVAVIVICTAVTVLLSTTTTGGSGEVPTLKNDAAHALALLLAALGALVICHPLADQDEGAAPRPGVARVATAAGYVGRLLARLR